MSPEAGAAATEAATWRSILTGAAALLSSPSDARHIVERAAGLDGPALIAALDEGAPRAAATAVERMVERRAAGAPLQYVVGGWAFRGLDLYLDNRVLIPRFETEQVVDVALEVLGAGGSHVDPGGGPGPIVADLGTGSGAIALAVAEEAPACEVWATDVSDDALQVASANLCGMPSAVTRRVHLQSGSWYAALPRALQGRVALVVSNPPYVTEGEWEGLASEVRDHEPRTALVPGPSGLEAIEVVVAGAGDWLAPGGGIVVEIAPSQAGAAVAMARAHGFAHAQVRLDLAQRERILIAADRPVP